MAKGSNQQFLCTACSAIHGRWYGQCNACESWNTIEAQRVPELRSTSCTMLTKNAWLPQEVLTGNEPFVP